MENKIIEEMWKYIKFKEKGVNFKNFNNNSVILCEHVYAKRDSINIGAFPHIAVKVFYKILDDVEINLPIEKQERKTNPFKLITYNTIENLDLKVGLYLQTISSKNLKVFEKDMDLVKDEDFDILVFPETCFTPFTLNTGIKSIYDYGSQQEFINDCLGLSNEINKAVVVSTVDVNDVLFSVYANANASKDETISRIYIKHTMTDNSPFIDDKYEDWIDELFTPIYYKGYSIGLTICYDCNHAPFSRMYGLQNVDLILNSTGGDVVYDKWYKYNKARAIENKCFNLVTMGGWDEDKKKNFTYAFNPNGGLILPVNMDKEEKPLKPGKIYIYALSNCSLESTPENAINQDPTISKKIDFEIPVGNSDEIISKSKKVKDDVYVYPVDEYNVVFCLVDGNNILKAKK